MQRAALAREIGRSLTGFDRVSYPDWDALFGRFWEEAKPGTALVLDELPALVAAAPEVPSILQRYVDRAGASLPKLILCGSSQRMMQGLVLDRTAPLFGRAQEILRIGPLRAGWIGRALRLADDRRCVEAFAVWGGVPRYWELAADFRSTAEAMRSLVLSPLGVLHDEPSALLLEDLREIAQAASVLTLIGQGAHRLSEIAGRLGKPATSLSRPLERLLELQLVRRDLPFGSSTRDTKRTLYRIADPFLRFWFRFVEPNRSRLEAGKTPTVAREIATSLPSHVAGVWEDLVRESVLRARYFGREWGVARPWWGAGIDRTPMEIDLVAESDDGQYLLVGEAKWTRSGDTARLAASLARKAENLPLARGRKILLGIWLPRAGGIPGAGARIFTPRRVLSALR